jgi:hypothetical protein
MAGNKKTRKAYKPRSLVNPISAAMRRAGKLTEAEQALMIDPIRDCFARLRMGQWANEDYKFMADCMNVAQALVKLNIVSDHLDKFDAAHYALRDLAERWNAGHNWVAKAEELKVLGVAIVLHEIQLQFASAGELAEATQIVDRVIRGAQSGSPAKGHLHTTLRKPEDKSMAWAVQMLEAA